MELHPQLKQDSLILGQFPLCILLLIKDANYPWFVLVPDREEVTEVFQLSEKDQIQLIYESSMLAKVLSDSFCADKMNIAAIGNMVPQLHIHHIVRYKKDISWPAPVWGRHPPKNYNDEELKSILARIKMLGFEGFENQV
ncbi:MAG: HIT domain-containing protein [Gammaproteobacteria bacterium]|nr:HIT domain-containing protein [Gammaproteobacteria bacterium]